MAYSDPYEDWKQQGRPGDFSTWQSQQASPTPPPMPSAPPPTRPPMPTTTAANQGGSVPPPMSTGGSIPRPMPTPAPAPAGPRPPAAPLLTPLQNGQTVEQAFATQRANTDWRDTNVSQDQWGAWEEEERKRVENGTSAQQTTPGGCPPDKPFTGRMGQCAYKPDDCPDGMHVVGTPGTCVPDGEGAGGGAGGPGGGGGAGGGYGAGGPGADQANTIWQAILSRLQGGTRYTPEVMDSLLSQTKNTAEAQAANQRQEALAEAASRGMARAPETGAAMRGIRANTYGQILNQKNQILRAKIDADYQDKSEAIKSGMDWLNSLRDYVTRMAATDAQKQAAMANITLGYARLSQEMDMMREEYAQRVQSATLGM